jgi:hypothetical protein
MPFQSEKQRRFLWAAHPDIAKRWAHEYPESNKGLPMYADKKDHDQKKPSANSKEKAAALAALSAGLAQFSGNGAFLICNTEGSANAKTAMDSLVKVDIPHSDKPTYAGQEREQGEQKLDNAESSQSESREREECDKEAAQSLLAKISTVLAKPFRNEMETAQALAEGREPRFVPQNMGLKRYSIPSPYITPPMGTVNAPANASAAQGAQTAQQGMPQPSNSPVGGGSNPQHNPIQAFGPLGAKGQLNGNAAFGQKNSPDSSKTAGITSILGGNDEKMPGWYGAEGLVDVGNAYRYGHTHGVDVVDKPPGWLRRIFDRDPYVLREDVPKYKRKLKAIRGMHVMEQPNRLEFSHMGQLKPEMRQLIEAALAKQGAASPAWQRSEGKNPEGGLNEKGRKSYEKAHGGNLKPPVTESNPSGERKKRQNSFCARMCGMKRVNTGSETKSDPDSRINKSLRKWNCKCGSVTDLAVLAGLAQSEKSANFMTDLTRNLSSRMGTMAGIFGREAAPALPSRVAGAAQTAAKKVLSMSTAHPSVLPALSAARREAVPGARLSELAEFLWNRTPRPIAPPTTRLRMPDGIHMFRRFGDTEAAQAAMSKAMQRYTRVGQAAGRIPSSYGTGEFVSFFGDVPTKATTWGQLQGIRPKSACDLFAIARGAAQAEKISIDVSRGGLPAMALSSTLGHLGGFPSNLILSPQLHVNPTDWTGAAGVTDPEAAPEDIRAQKMKALAQTMAQADPQALSNHQVYLGGPRFFREIKRTMTNPRTSVAGKAIGTASLPLSYLATALTRGNAYNPFSDSTYLYGNNPAALSHELGHALDFNAKKVPEYEPGKNKLLTWLRRQGTGLQRDLYSVAGKIPLVSLLHEANANQRSERALRKALGDKPNKLNEILHDRQKVLPAGYGSYAGKMLGGPNGALAGLVGGKAYGLLQAARRKGTYADDKPEDSNSDRDESESASKSKADRQKKEKSKK